MKKKNELDSEGQEFEREVLKPWLKFRVGDIVYIKTDFSRQTPMVIKAYALNDDVFDYHCIWFNSQKSREDCAFPEKALIKESKHL